MSCTPTATDHGSSGSSEAVTSITRHIFRSALMLARCWCWVIASGAAAGM
ncbi:hypothetical protein [Desulfurispora thermophila]|nr:hypothetical protein [Desulfurispora thermophila]